MTIRPSISYAAVGLFCLAVGGTVWDHADKGRAYTPPRVLPTPTPDVVLNQAETFNKRKGPAVNCLEVFEAIHPSMESYNLKLKSVLDDDKGYSQVRIEFGYNGNTYQATCYYQGLELYDMFLGKGR